MDPMPTIAFITGDFNTSRGTPEPNGCAYYRMFLPSGVLRERGLDVSFGMPVSSPEQGLGIGADNGAYFGWDITVLKLMMHESVPGAMEFMQKRGQRVLVDVDDFHFGISKDNIASHITDPSRNPENNRMIYEMGIRQADAVIVSTAFLANFYEQRVRDVRLVRNSIDTHRYTPVDHPDQPVIGWVGATPWRSGDIELLGSWLPAFAQDHGVTVHHSGHIPGDSKHFGARIGMGRVQTSIMQSMANYPSLLTKFHIGLVPLVRSPFNESKSFLKGLEYAAAGIPFIATPTEEYRLLREAGVGRLAETPDEWRDHATELLDPDVRRAEAQRQRSIVERDFDISGKGEAWATAILG